MRILKYLLFLAIAAVLAGYILMHKKNYQVITGEVFGTYYTVKLRSFNEDKMLQKALKEEFDKINSQMSVFDNESEISAINRAPAGEWIELSKDMQNLLKNAYSIYQMSSGAFDPTVGKLVDLWGFGTKGGIQKIPDDEEIREILQFTGFDKITFSRDFSKLNKKYDKTIINLSAIAKGYGVDSVAAMLTEHGYTDFVVEIGGEVVAKGKKSDARNGWNIGVADPKDNGESNAFVVTLKDYAAATSGDYRNFFYIGDKKYSHTINPKTGYPVENALLSVTVFDKSCMNADGLATAIMSMGEKKAIDFIKDKNLAAVLFVRDEKGDIYPIISAKASKMGIK